MTIPILYSFRRCPYAMRARLALSCAKIEVEIREVLLKEKPRSLLVLSPKGTVPVLLLPNGTIIEESLEIMHWALDFIGWSTTSEMDKLILDNDHFFKSWLDKYKYANRFPQHSAIFYRAQAEIFIQKLESLLVANHSDEQKIDEALTLFGENTTIADLAIFPFVRQFAGVDPAWFEQSEYPVTRAWLKQNIDSDLFKMIMAKNIQWVD